MKQIIAVLLLILPLQALASYIGFDHSQAESSAFDFARISRSGDDPTSLGESGTFQLKLPGILSQAEFCTLSQRVGCGIAALMVAVGDTGTASQVDIVDPLPGPVTAFGMSATRVPVPSALGLFVTGLLVLVAIRRKRPI